MAKLSVRNFTLTLDGFATGTNQRLGAPFGDGVDGIHDWMFAAQRARETDDLEGGESDGLDETYAARFNQGIGATIMGRNMFGPYRGPWEDHTWTGWWGDNPPFHHDVFVLTHHGRPPVEMEGGTTFHFVAGTPEAVLERAVAAAGGQDVALGGGAATLRQFLRAGLVDDLHLVTVPILAGAGERLYDDLAGVWDGYEVTRMVSSKAATHVEISRRKG